MYAKTILISSFTFLAVQSIPVPSGGYGYGGSSTSAPGTLPSTGGASSSPIGGVSPGATVGNMPAPGTTGAVGAPSKGYGSSSSSSPSIGGVSPVGGASSVGSSKESGEKGGVVVGDSTCVGLSKDVAFSALENLGCDLDSDSVGDANTGNLAGDGNGLVSGDGNGDEAGNKNAIFSDNLLAKKQVLSPTKGSTTVGDNVGVAGAEGVLGSLLDNGSDDADADSLFDGETQNGSDDLNDEGSENFNKDKYLNANKLGSGNSLPIKVRTTGFSTVASSVKDINHSVLDNLSGDANGDSALDDNEKNLSHNQNDDLSGNGNENKIDNDNQLLSNNVIYVVDPIPTISLISTGDNKDASSSNGGGKTYSLINIG